MKKLILALLYFFWTQNANALCEQHNININIITRPGKVLYDTKHRRADFKNLINTPVNPNTLGLTVFKLETHLRGEPYIKQEGNRYCIGISSVDLIIGVEDIKVYIDKKYPSSSCNYRVIKEHEDYHVQVLQQALSFYQEDLKKKVRAAVMGIWPEYTYTRERSTQIMNKYFKQIQERIKPAVRQIEKKIAEKNAEIDTPQSYKETTKLCPSW